MDVDAGKPLPASEVEVLIAQLEAAVGQEACWSCARVQEFIAQLERDAGPKARALLAMYEVRREKLHGCLGCQPCPPGDLFAECQARR
jgi:hypothetical protein